MEYYLFNLFRGSFFQNLLVLFWNNYWCNNFINSHFSMTLILTAGKKVKLKPRVMC